MKKKSLLTMVVALSLVSVIGIGATFAYLTSGPQTVTNTFTVGKGYVNQALTLNEAEVTHQEDGTFVADEAKRVQENTYDNLQPGNYLPKDPTVTLVAGSTKSYVFVSFENIDELVKKLGVGTTVDGWSTTGWQKLPVTDSTVNENSMDGVYYQIVDVSSEESQDFVHEFFTGIQIDGNNNDVVKATDIPQIIGKAAAVQFSTLTVEQAYAQVATDLGYELVKATE